MEETIREAVRHLGGWVWHDRDSRRRAVTDEPDLRILVPGRYLLIELKSQRRDLTAGQAAALEMAAGIRQFHTGVVRPNPRAGEWSLDEVLSLIQGSNEAVAAGQTG